MLTAPIVSQDSNHSPRQPTHLRVAEICQLRILIFLHAADVIQTLSRTSSLLMRPVDLDLFVIYILDGPSVYSRCEDKEKPWTRRQHIENRQLSP